MKILNKLLLAMVCSLAIISTSFADTTVNGDEYWPFPLGAECPFAWNFVSSTDWQFELNGEAVDVAFYISQEATGFMRIMTVVYKDKDKDDWELIARGTEVFKERSFILPLRLVDFRDNSKFSISLRLYDNASKILPEEASILRFPGYPEKRMCTNMSNTSLAATVINECKSPICNKPIKHQIMSQKNP